MKPTSKCKSADSARWEAAALAQPLIERAAVATPLANGQAESGIDLAGIFSFTVSPPELMLRGTLMDWFLFIGLRFVLRRDVGALGLIRNDEPKAAA